MDASVRLQVTQLCLAQIQGLHGGEARAQLARDHLPGLGQKYLPKCLRLGWMRNEAI